MVLDNVKENSIPTRGDLWDTGACVRLRYEPMQVLEPHCAIFRSLARPGRLLHAYTDHVTMHGVKRGSRL